MMKRGKLFIAIILLIICMGGVRSGVTAAPVERSSHVLLQIPNIQGESTAAGYTNWIELSEAEFSSQIPLVIQGGARAAVSSPKEDDISITRQVDTASGAIFKKHLMSISAGSSSNPYQDWVIVFLNDSGVPYLKYTLKEPIINNYKINNKARFAPEETFSINYTGITVTTWDNRGIPSSISYDLAAQKIY